MKHREFAISHLICLHCHQMMAINMETQTMSCACGECPVMTVELVEKKENHGHHKKAS